MTQTTQASVMFTQSGMGMPQSKSFSLIFLSLKLHQQSSLLDTTMVTSGMPPLGYPQGGMMQHQQGPPPPYGMPPHQQQHWPPRYQ